MSSVKVTIDLSDYTLEQLDIFLLEGVISLDEYRQEMENRLEEEHE